MGLVRLGHPPRWSRQCGSQIAGEAGEEIGLGTRGGEGDAHPTCGFDDAAAILSSGIRIVANSAVASFFRKEVVNRAMRWRSLVEYDNVWGVLNVAPYVPNGAAAAPGPAGILGKGLQSQIDQAAIRVAPAL